MMRTPTSTTRTPSLTVRSVLLGGASAGALGLLLASNAAMAQSSLLGAGRTAQAAVQAATRAAAPPITGGMQQILARHQQYQARIGAQATAIAQANAAARAAAQAAAQAGQQSVRDGLQQGGLVPVAVAQQNTSALTTWVGANQPTQTANGNFVDVTVNQTQSRALLSWDNFDVGTNTNLIFNQQGNKDWVAVNRVVGGIDPATGLLDAARGPKPSEILGSIRADGTVYVLNRAGVMFGATSQVNLNSLVASTLEIGAAKSAISNALVDRTLEQRNQDYLLNGILPAAQSTLLASVTGEQHGDVTAAPGSRIQSTGGFVILGAPNVVSAGEIVTAAGGQVSLQAGTQIDAIISSGAQSSIDRYVRGLVLASTGGGSVAASGAIDAPQGYISLGTDQFGSVDFSGILTSTTSVSRNGKISLLGGTVDIGVNAAIAITPDTSASTIPQSADSFATFKTSQIDIGTFATRDVTAQILVLNSPLGEESGAKLTTLLPAAVDIGAGATIQATGGDINIGGRAGEPNFAVGEITVPGLGIGSVSIAADAVLDVSGMPDVLIDPARNQLIVSPAKRNELRDTPTYRETTTDGSFTLNGAILFVDPRLSGVRDDGVTWIGSPLIEAGSLAAQIGITASEILTKGGNITLATMLSRGGTVQALDAVGSVNVAAGATLDFGGGWVRYQDGFIRRTKLVTSDGRIVDIASANRNDRYVGISSGFSEFLPQLAAPRVFASLASGDSHFEAGYSEGRDAGTLTIQAPTATMNGTLFGQAVAGARQVEAGLEASAASTIAGDVRRVQTIANELPAGGLLRVTSFDRAKDGSFALGGAILVGQAPAEAPADGTIILSDATLSAAGLSGLSLQTSAGVTLAENSLVQLAPGGALNIDAGRAILFGGTVEAAGGSITARTYNFIDGSPFTADDDGPSALNGILTSNLAVGDFDIRLEEGALLSTAGRWMNDLLVTDGTYQGPGYIDGGSISLTVAPHVAGYTDAERDTVVDLSGSILISAGSLLDVSAGGYVATTGDIDLTGKGGDVSLINETVYFQVAGSQNGFLDKAGLSSNGSPFLTTPVNVGGGFTAFLSQITPDVINARVDIAAGTIEGFGFGGGGTFKLVTPDLNFGSSGGTGTAIPLDFLTSTGFGTLDLSAWNTAIIRRNVFSNGRTGNTGLLGTEQLVIRAGETLNLTQSIRRSILDLDELEAVQALASGTDLGTVAVLAPTNQLGDYDNLAAHLVLGGLTELDIVGGTVTGAPTASITAPRLYNDGTIAISGGSITQKLVLPDSYGRVGQEAVGLLPMFDADGVDQGAGLEALFGPADENGQFDELAINPFFTRSGQPLTNRDVVAGDGTGRQVYYLGQIDGQATVAANEGLVFTADSVTDLSGTSILNPRAGFAANGSPIVQGRMIAGGSIRALDRFDGGDLFSKPGFGADFYVFNGSSLISPFSPLAVRVPVGIVARPGEGAGTAQIDLSGASAEFDLQTSTTSYVRTPVWSNAGSLSALGGGDIAAATIRAVGGSANALGGTIEWTNPILSQAMLPGTGTLSVDQIAAAGFDSLIARGAVSALGDVSLKLDRSFLLRSRDFNGNNASVGSYYDVSLNAASPALEVPASLAITAPYISLASINPGAGTPPGQGVAGLEPINALSLSASAIDIAGSVGFGVSLGTVSLSALGDIRLIGVQPLELSLDPAAQVAPSLTGSLIVRGNLNLTAAQIYATTGTGNLQQLAENPLATPRPFLIAATGSESIIRFARTPGTNPTAPLSAGSYLSIIAPTIEQGGVLRAPLGRIDLGSRTARLVTTGGSSRAVTTDSVTLLPGSITSVSAAGLTIPYGTTTDLTEYFFTPTVAGALTAPPSASLNFGAGEITVAGATDSAPGAVVDASGGGSIFAYEFVSGVGGSRDVLSRFNSDAFSSQNGFQYPDGRQVYAILPIGDPAVSALYDPLYSSDYADLYDTDIGKTVVLESSPGFAGGTYVLMPAKYALNPGALRLVENVGDAAPLPGASRSLLDGSIVVGGAFGVRSSAAEAAALGLSGKSYVESTRRSFTVQDQDSFRSYSRIETTSGAQALSKRAIDAGLVIPRLPNDAARILLDPGKLLTIDAPFLTAAADGGRGSQVDLAGEIITIVSQLPEETDDGLYVTTGDLVDLNAASLLIGGIRTDKDDGTTNVTTTAREIRVSNDAASPLSAPEIVLAVSGENSLIDIADGSAIVASGTLADTRSGIYDFTTTEGGQRVGIIGSVLRVANGVERLVDISGDVLPTGVRDRASLDIGAATIAGQSVLLESSRNIGISEAASLSADLLALGSDTVAFSSRTFGIRGLIVTPELEATFAAIDRVTVRSSAAVGFTSGTHVFNDLVIDAPGVRALKARAGRDTDPIDVTIQATDLGLRNSGLALNPCTGGAALACGTGSTGNSLILDAQNLHLGGGTFRTSYGFDASVGIRAAGGANYSGVGTLDTGAAALSIVTPYLVDLGTGAMPDKDGAVLTQYQLLTTGGVTLSDGGAGTGLLPTTPLSPGASLAFGTIDAPVASFTNDGVMLRASAGRISVRATGDISLTGDAILATPSYSQSFGDAQDRVTVSAAGGTVSLLAKSGNIGLGADSRIDIGGTSGSNGAVELLASSGNIVLGASSNAIINAAAPAGGGSLSFDSGLGGFDFANFAATLGGAFSGDISVRTGTGDLTLGSGTVLRLDSLSLTADGGSVTIGGTIDASGISGGSIALFARDAVTLSAGSLLDVHADGYADTDSRRASAGDIILGAGDAGRIRVEAGAAIDLGARREGDRLIPYTQLDPVTLVPVTAYRFVEADQQGTLTLRAPVVDTQGGSTVDIAFAGTVTGGRDISVEGYRAYNLADIADDGSFTGVTITDGTAVLDTGASGEGKVNFLSDIASGTLPDFVRNFDIGASDATLGALTGLANFHRRPGIELRHSNGIRLASNWNLGAGTVDTAAAIADGDMRVSALSTPGNPLLEVVPGRESHLIENHVDMLYRVGGTAAGEAGRLTIRAGGTLDIASSITDGFFTFTDYTDPTYIDYQLGGGTRLYQPALQFSCSGAAEDFSCGVVQPYEPDLTGRNPTLPPIRESINIILTGLRSGQEIPTVDAFGTAPYNPLANSAAARGAGSSGAGNPIGSADLFPLLADGSAVDSFSYRLTGGAGSTFSANPLHVDRGTDADLIVSGEGSYELVSNKPVGAWAGDTTQLIMRGQDRPNAGADIFAQFRAGIGTNLSDEQAANAQTRVTLGNGSPEAVAFMREAACQYFGGVSCGSLTSRLIGDDFQFTGPATAPNGIAGTLSAIAGFLGSVDESGRTLLDRFGQAVTDGSLGIDAPAVAGGRIGDGGTVHYRSRVRTGTGSIDVAAARDVDLRNGDSITYRTEAGGKGQPNGGKSYQVGGTALYTAGRVVNPGATSARVVGTSGNLTIDPSAYLASNNPGSASWLPRRDGSLQVTPEYLSGGGSITVTAGDDVLGRQDVWTENVAPDSFEAVTIAGRDGADTSSGILGAAYQRWRVGSFGAGGDIESNIRVNAQRFTSGIGTLGGGDVAIKAGGDLGEMMIALDTTLTTGDVGTSFGSMTFGGGDLDVTIGGNLLGGRFDVASGIGAIDVGLNVASSPTAVKGNSDLQVRITDADVTIRAGGGVAIDAVTALGLDPATDVNARGFYTGNSALRVQAFGDVSLGDEAFGVPNQDAKVNVLPATLDFTSFGGNIALGERRGALLYPGATGQLSMLAAGTLASGTIAVDDADPSVLPGLFSAYRPNPENIFQPLFGRQFGFSLPSVLPLTNDSARRLYHNSSPTHLDDALPARIAVGGDLIDLTLYTPKATRVSAGRDIVNMIFVGQNVNASDVTRISAGRDITATGSVATQGQVVGRRIVDGNLFVIGGSGAMFVEAGRNMGPFLNSATLPALVAGSGGSLVGDPLLREDYAGGILAVGNDYNPWLAPKSADLYVFFGVAPGADFAALRETYVNPANTGALNGDLFEQNVDQFGNRTPDRSRPIYSPILIQWMQDQQSAALLAAFGTTDVTATQAYQVFATLPDLVQRRFLLDKVHFNELATPAQPDGDSYLQYARGYLAVETLFNPALGYTQSLERDANGAYVIDPETGFPARLADAIEVSTGNLDLRLAAIETTRNSNITLLGPGGDAILGSVVRTTTQASRLAYQPQLLGLRGEVARPAPSEFLTLPLLGIPLGYEGMLTLRGGGINSFTDGDLRLNQSRLFTQQSGDIVAWSSNGDLNAGQGPKSGGSVPPIVLRFNPNGGTEVDAAGGVVGAGIAGFAGLLRLNPQTGQFELIDATNDPDAAAAFAQLAGQDEGIDAIVNGKTYRRERPSITLVAPAGTIDAGDAGVRAAGDIFVAAESFANTDSFSSEGGVSGIATASVVAATPASAASAAVANVFQAEQANTTDQRSRISVDVLGVYSFSDDGGASAEDDAENDRE